MTYRNWKPGTLMLEPTKNINVCKSLVTTQSPFPRVPSPVQDLYIIPAPESIPDSCEWAPNRPVNLCLWAFAVNSTVFYELITTYVLLKCLCLNQNLWLLFIRWKLHQNLNFSNLWIKIKSTDFYIWKLSLYSYLVFLSLNYLNKKMLWIITKINYNYNS